MAAPANGNMPGMQQVPSPQQCGHVARCKVKDEIFPALQEIDRAVFQAAQPDNAAVQTALQTLLSIAERYFRLPGDALDCRAGGAQVFYRLAEIYRFSVGAVQRAHNLYQLAMSMFWDMSREPGGIECLESGQVWGLDFGAFMDAYLSLAKEVHRHEPEGLPPPHKFDEKHYKKRKIAITSVCAYKEEHMLHELYPLVKQNRDRYAKVHGYDSHLWNVTFDASRAPVWSAVGLPLSLVQAPSDYDWVLAADCDMMFVNMHVPLERILDEYVNEDTDPEAKNVHVLITEDGRGLAGGIFLIRNSKEGREIIESVYGGALNNVYDRHDLKDQWSFLWHFIRPKATREIKPVELTDYAATGESGTRRRTWGMLEYADKVRLVPQKYLNAYPWASCRPSHHCFDDDEDLVISFITLGSFSKEMAYAMLNKFLDQSLKSYAKLTGRMEL
eukprot:g8621.t1